MTQGLGVLVGLMLLTSAACGGSSEETTPLASNGPTSPSAKAKPSPTASTKPKPPKAKPTRAAATYPARLFENCTAFNTRWPHGVGKKTAIDKTSGDPVASFERNTRLYLLAMNKNGRLDGDGDGVACESV